MENIGLDRITSYGEELAVDYCFLCGRLINMVIDS